METQPILEILVKLNPKMDSNQADQARTVAEMKAGRKAYQARMDTKHKETMANIDAEMEAIRAETKAMRDKGMKTNRESDQEELKGIIEEMNAKAGGKQEEMLVRMREEIKSGQAEMKSIICTFGCELKETLQRVMRAAIKSVGSELDETTACQEAHETEPDQRMMQSAEERQKIRKEEAAVMPAGEPRKQLMVCDLAAERSQKRKERTQENRGSRRKSAAACRKVARRSKVAWRKRNVFRNVQAQRNCGPRKRLTVTGIRTTRCAKVARHKKRNHEGPSVEQGRRKEQTRNKFTSGIRKRMDVREETWGGSGRQHWCEGF
jgi:hypothetical protein